MLKSTSNWVFNRQILNQTSRKELKGRWVFLGTDGWGKKWYPVESFGRVALNAITIAPKLYLISGRIILLTLRTNILLVR